MFGFPRKIRFDFRVRKLWCMVLLCAAACSVWPTFAAAQAPYRRIAKTGDPVPGLADTTFYSVCAPTIDANGNIAFRNRMRGPGVGGLNDDAIFYGRPGNLGLVVREGSPPPGFGLDVGLRTLPSPGMAQTGEIAFDGWLDAPGIGTDENDILYAGQPDNLQLVAREGETPPDVTDGRVYGRDFDLTMGRGGHLAYRGDLIEPGHTGIPDQQGLWAGTPENPRLVARTGGQAPGTEPGVVFSSSSVAPSFSVNSRGAIAFPAVIDGPGVGALNAGGIWAGTHTDVGLVLRAGDPAPLPEANATFFGTPTAAVINGNDRVLFPSFVSGTGIDASNDFSIWTGDTQGNFELIAREGDEVPLLGPDFTVTGMFPYLFSENDKVTLVEKFSGPGVTVDNDEVILFGEFGEWDLLFREGDQAPGLPTGVVLNFDVDTPKITIVESGAAGMILGLDGPGITVDNDEALFWRPSADAAWQLVAREGEIFDGSIILDGGLFIQAGGGAAGTRPSLNDRGDLVFWIQFEGEVPNEVFGAYIVPEPGTTILALVNIVLVSQRKRRSAVDR